MCVNRLKGSKILDCDPSVLDSRWLTGNLLANIGAQVLRTVRRFAANTSDFGRAPLGRRRIAKFSFYPRLPARPKHRAFVDRWSMSMPFIAHKKTLGTPSMRSPSLFGLLALAFGALSAGDSSAQDSEAKGSAPRQRSYQNAREAYREKLNENVLFLMGGQLGAAYIAVAHDISIVTNDGANLRVLPVVGGAGAQNVHDVVFLRGIDLALTNVQTLDLMKKTGELGPNLERQISYIAPLFPEELQILARGDLHTLAELKGKRVNFNNKGSATAMLTPAIFQELGIETQEFYMSQPDAIQKIKAGELDATVCMCPTPVPAFANIKADSNLGLIDVSYPEKLHKSYLPATISHEDYPNLLPKGGKVDTVASTTVLIAFNWPKGSTRYNRTAKFVDAFFTKFADLQKPPRHPLWKSVNYAANLPAWQRFPAAQEWLDQHRSNQEPTQQKPTPSVAPPPAQQKPMQQAQSPLQTATMEAKFNQFIKEREERNLPTPSNPSQNEQLFQEFMDWMKTSRR
jgi:uncharacterized protein